MRVRGSGGRGMRVTWVPHWEVPCVQGTVHVRWHRRSNRKGELPLFELQFCRRGSNAVRRHVDAASNKRPSIKLSPLNREAIARGIRSYGWNPV